MGSDPRREQLSLFTYWSGRTTSHDNDYKTNPCWLFERDPDSLPSWILDTQKPAEVKVDSKVEDVVI